MKKISECVAELEARKDEIGKEEALRLMDIIKDSFDMPIYHPEMVKVWIYDNAPDRPEHGGHNE
jgi:hypothetical protein